MSTAYGEDKRKGCNMLLEQIEEGIKSCLCLAPTYEELELLYMTRRLYVAGGGGGGGGGGRGGACPPRTTA